MFKRFAVGLLALGATLTPSLTTPATADTAPDPVIVIAGFASPDLGGLPLALRIHSATDAKYYTIAGSRGSGTGSIADGATDLSAKVDQVLAETGASKVDLVSLSMGGLTARYYLKNLGGTAKVDTLVQVVPPNHGTNRANLAKILSCAGIVACDQMAIGSTFLTALNAGDETPGAVAYSTIRTDWDEVVVPIDSAKLDGAENIKVQDQCLLHFVEHQGAALDGVVADGVIDALRHQPIHMNCWA